jgi:hypothetical protein
MSTHLQENCIVYDGECPFCSRYVALIRLRDAVGPIKLINARDGGTVVEELRSQGYSLDEGMVLILNGAVHHGPACINRLALLSSRSNWFNRANAAVFRSSVMSRAFYPVLRTGRLVALSIMGRSLLGDGDRKRRFVRAPFTRYRRRMVLLFSLLLVYSLIAEAGGLRIAGILRLPMTHGELYPFFRWSLFSKPARYAKSYTIEPVAVSEGSPLAVSLHRAIDVGEASFLGDIRFHKTAGSFAAAISAGDELLISNRKALLDNFLKPYGVRRYRLVLQEIDPLVREQRTVIRLTDLGQFDVAQ